MDVAGRRVIGGTNSLLKLYGRNVPSDPRCQIRLTRSRAGEHRSPPLKTESKYGMKGGLQLCYSWSQWLRAMRREVCELPKREVKAFELAATSSCRHMVRLSLSSINFNQSILARPLFHRLETRSLLPSK